ncbi:MAG: c-type cytochrome [Pararhodobacter sp.]
MNKTYSLFFAALAFTTSPALAEGDAEAGAAAFNQCQSCHVVANDAGEVLAGRNARTGPNLYGVIGRTAGSVDGFRYGDGIVAAGEAGLVWDEESTVAYLQDPTSFIREAAGNPRARSNMTFRVRSEDQARDLYAFLATFSPQTEEVVEDAEEDEAPAAD